MFRSILFALAVCVAGTACAPQPTPVPQATLKVLATESFLADVAQNVAGKRLKVDTLIPSGVDPHTFEPTPADVRRVADSRVLIANGAGLEEFLDKLLANAGGTRLVIEASAGLKSREAKHDEKVETGTGHHHHEADPHFWLDPNHVIKYVENIRDGLSQADPAGAATYKANADAYIAQLKELDKWIAEQVKALPPERRLLVTNHESFGYFADRYGFEIVGTIMPSVSTEASPSAQQLAALINQIKTAKVKAIFLETGTNPQLAKQIAQETGVKVVMELYTHSLTDAKGPAPTYLAMMKYNTQTIVDALK